MIKGKTTTTKCYPLNETDYKDQIMS